MRAGIPRRLVQKIFPMHDSPGMWAKYQIGKAIGDVEQAFLWIIGRKGYFPQADRPRQC